MLLTQQELANKSGYSRKTVSKALQGHPDVPQVTREKILAMAQKYRYRPNSAARAIRDNRTRQIGVMLRNAPDRPLDNPHNAEFLLGINTQLATEGYLVVLVRIGDVAKALGNDSRVFEERVLDGMIISGAIPEDILTHVHALVPNCIYMDTNRWTTTGCLRRDEFAAGKLCAQRVIAAGYQRLVWMAAMNPAEHYSVTDRYAGICAAAKAADVPLVQECENFSNDSEQWLPFVERMKKLAVPDMGVIAYNTLTAQRCAMAAMELGRIAPRDFGLTCCDDSYMLNAAWPGLSRVSFDRFKMGTLAAEMMLRQLNHNPAGQGCPSYKMPVQWLAGQTIKQGSM